MNKACPEGFNGPHDQASQNGTWETAQPAQDDGTEPFYRQHGTAVVFHQSDRGYGDAGNRADGG
jgi:hypothetical protein